ncbi:unnamed protein product, partial [Symbiodinium pilosum]
MQLAAVLKDTKSKKEVEAHADELDAIAKEWPIVNIVKLQTLSDLPKAGSRTQAAKELASKQSDFEKIKGAMAGTSPKTFQAPAIKGDWREMADSWSFSAKVTCLTAISACQLQINDSYLRLLDSEGSLLVKTFVPETLDKGKLEASWSRNQGRLEVSGPKKVKSQEGLKKSIHVDSLD